MTERAVNFENETQLSEGTALYSDTKMASLIAGVDQELLRNCIINFVSNAAQAMNDGGVITLGAARDEAGGRVRLTFADHGKGISEEDLAKIFQPYFTTKEVGIGLGLAITERIIREHGGEILVESRPGEGTTFTVTMPLVRAGQARGDAA